MDWKQHITVDPEVLSGKPIVRGTRLAVDFVLGLLADGWSEAKVLENYPALTSDSIRAVFAFAAETLGDQSLFPLQRDVG